MDFIVRMYSLPFVSLSTVLYDAFGMVNGNDLESFSFVVQVLLCHTGILA